MIFKNLTYLVFGFHLYFTIRDNTAAGCPGCSQCWPQHLPSGPGHPDTPGGQSQCHRVQCLHCVTVILWRRVHTRDTQLRGKEEQIMTVHNSDLRDSHKYFQKQVWGKRNFTSHIERSDLTVASIELFAMIPHWCH